MLVSGRNGITLLILLMAFIGLALPVHAAPAWNVQVVDDKAGLAGGLCLALDSTGTPHMAYVDSENGSYFIPGSGYVRSPQYIMYTRLGEGPKVVDRWNQPARGLSGAVSSLALDSNDKPHIVYSIYSFTESNYTAPNVYVLTYATLTGANWSIQRVDQGTVGSLALDSDGNPHIAYAAADGNLKYASWTGDGWSIETVDLRQSNPGNPFGFMQSLALDADDCPNIIYLSAYTPEMEPGVYYPEEPKTETIIKWARWDTAGWTVQNVSNADVSSLGNAVLDAKGYPHFVYHDEGTDLVRYESWNGLAWVGRTVTEGSIYNVYGDALTLDSEGSPRIAFWARYGSDLMYARWTWSGWDTQTVVTLPDTIYSFTISLTLDSEGNPHMAYMILRHSPGPFVDATVMYATSNQPVQTVSLEFLLLMFALLLAVGLLIALDYIREKRTLHTPQTNTETVSQEKLTKNADALALFGQETLIKTLLSP